MTTPPSLSGIWLPVSDSAKSSWSCLKVGFFLPYWWSGVTFLASYWHPFFFLQENKPSWWIFEYHMWSDKQKGNFIANLWTKPTFILCPSRNITTFFWLQIWSLHAVTSSDDVIQSTFAIWPPSSPLVFCKVALHVSSSPCSLTNEMLGQDCTEFALNMLGAINTAHGTWRKALWEYTTQHNYAAALTQNNTPAIQC